MSANPRAGQSWGEVIDLFAGPGGWDVGASCLGIAPRGIEWDESACKTREAAGHRTLQGDVAQLDPASFGPCEGLIASPPCQSFSMAGKRGGEQDTEHVIACAYELAAGNDTRAEHRAKCEDARSMLVVEPLRWVRDLRPRWVALEQVPPVLGLWTLFAGLMEAWGYRTWVGVLSAERYGVPQTRKRAILLASLDFQPHPPEPTHQAYVPGEPQRHEVTMFGEVLPWVSMAEALGWGEGERPTPAPTVTSGGTAQGGVEVFASKGARERVMRANAQPNAAMREAVEPAPTITGGHDTSDRVWQVRTTWGEPDANSPTSDPREQPCRTVPTVADRWTVERPATTIMPGVNRSSTELPNGSDASAVRVSVEEAAILQSFPPDYPWQGSRTAQFQQIGNAVPPKLAEAVLRQVAQVREPQEAAA